MPAIMNNREFKNFLLGFEARETERCNAVMALLKSIARKVSMADETLDTLLADATQAATVGGSAIALLNAVVAKLNANPSTAFTAAQQAELNNIGSVLEASNAAVSAAITANTPAAPAAGS
jgi:hypothetical protein